MIRRMKKDILKELPKKIRTVVEVEVEDEEKREQLRWVGDESSFVAFIYCS